MNIKKTLVVFNGFLHDFAAGIWLAAIAAIALLHREHLMHPDITSALNGLERSFFWASVVAIGL